MKEPKLLEPMVALTLSNRKGVVGDKTWCVEGTRIPVEILGAYLSQNGLEKTLEDYPSLIRLILKGTSQSTDVKIQVKRFKGFLSRCWIPTTSEEKEIFDEVEAKLVPYVETLLKQISK